MTTRREPEPSYCSPTLFIIFVADLIPGHKLKDKFLPMQLLTLARVIIHQIYTLVGSTTQIWIRILLDPKLNVHIVATEAIRVQ